MSAKTVCDSVGQQRLIELTAGHPLAVARLRAMNAVIEAAKLVFTDEARWTRELNGLRNTLIAGGWLE